MARIYVSISGDTWDLIAYKVYGSGGERLTHKLLAANPSLRCVAVFGAGAVVQVPDAEEARVENRPPWKES